jgi:hypothetical protein
LRLPSLLVMEWDSTPDPLSFTGKRLPAFCQLELVRIEPGCERPYDAAEWGDAIILVEEGEIDLECVDGGSRHFKQGATLFLAGLPLRALVNRGSVATVLSAVSRRR